jgi:hypothetical protein
VEHNKLITWQLEVFAFRAANIYATPCIVCASKQPTHIFPSLNQKAKSTRAASRPQPLIICQRAPAATDKPPQIPRHKSPKKEPRRYLGLIYDQFLFLRVSPTFFLTSIFRETAPPPRRPTRTRSSGSRFSFAGTWQGTLFCSSWPSLAPGNSPAGN